MNHYAYYIDRIEKVSARILPCDALTDLQDEYHAAIVHHKDGQEIQTIRKLRPILEKLNQLWDKQQ